MQGLLNSLQTTRKGSVEKRVLRACLFSNLPGVEMQRMLDSSMNGVTELSLTGEKSVSEEDDHENEGNKTFFAVMDNAKDCKMDTSEENGNRNISVIERWKPSGGFVSARKKTCYDWLDLINNVMIIKGQSSTTNFTNEEGNKAVVLILPFENGQ